MTDLTDWRADTPGCANRVHLNNAGAGLMPRPVLAEIERHLRLESDIGGYEAADQQAERIAAGLGEVARLVGAAPRNVAIVESATAGFAAALSAFDFRPGDRIITTRCDYTSNQIQYLAMAARLGVEVVHAADLPEGGVDPDDVRRLASSRPCRLIAVSWIPTNSGLVQDVAAVGEVAEAFGVPYLVDACQAVGQMPVDVTALRCDYLSATGRKFLRGPRGIGFLYVADRALARGDHPLHVDMYGARWSDTGRITLAETAARFQAWERSQALVLGQAAAARYASAVGLDRIRELAWGHAAALRSRLAELPRIRVLDRGAVRCAIVTFAIEGVESHAAVLALRGVGINASSAPLEVARIDFAAKGVESAVRFSPHYYNSADELDTAVEAVRELSDR